MELELEGFEGQEGIAEKVRKEKAMRAQLVLNKVISRKSQGVCGGISPLSLSGTQFAREK